MSDAKVLLVKYTHVVWTSCYLVQVSLHDEFQLILRFFSLDLISVSSYFVQVGLSCSLCIGMHGMIAFSFPDS